MIPAARRAIPAPEEARHWRLERFTSGGEPVLHRAVGCEQCDGIGYRGRSAIVELLVMSDPIRRQVMRHATSGEIQHLAVEEGMRTMYFDGLNKCLQGVTSLDEVLRVTQEA